jgi:hypothetical protein
MNLNRNIALALVFFGVVGLLSSLWSIGYVIFGKDPAQTFNPDHMRKVVDTAVLSSALSIATIGFGLYNWDKIILAVFGAVGISFSILVALPLLGMGFLRSFNNSGFMNEFTRLLTAIVYVNVLFIAALIVGVMKSGRR